MIYKNVTYKGLDLCDEKFFARVDPSHLVLQDMDMSVAYETKKESLSSGHGEKGYNTVAKSRTIIISGKVASSCYRDRQSGIDYLKRIIIPEGILSNTPYYRLEWEDFKNRRFYTMARVNSELKVTHDIGSPFIEFSFDLWAEYPQYFSIYSQTISVTPSQNSYGFFTGGSSGVHLGYPTTSTQGTLITNEGNFTAGVIINDNSGLDSNFYYNNTNGLKYGVSGIANSRIIDTTMSPTIVTDGGINASKYRMRGSSGFLLSPGDNYIVVSPSTYDYSVPITENSVTFTYTNTYI